MQSLNILCDGDFGRARAFDLLSLPSQCRLATILSTSAPSDLLANMPDELFTLYMEPLIEEHGFPFYAPSTPTHMPWKQLFDCHELTGLVVPDSQDKFIRGNRRSMIYRWPGCPNYDDIAPHNRVPFNSRAEAEQAGYRAARNCH